MAPESSAPVVYAQSASPASVSVIIPCYNVSRWVGECIDSVFEQTVAPSEIICVDDGSTDDTADRLEDARAKRPDWVRVIRTRNAGAAAARNRGLAVARGEWIQFLDADDLLKPSKLAHQLTLILETDVRPDLVAADYEIVRPDGSVDSVAVSADGPWAGLVTSRLGCTCSNLWRRTSLIEVGGWTVQLASSQEYDLMLRMLCARGTVLVDRTALTTVRSRSSGSISSSNLEANLIRLLEVQRRALEQIRERRPDDRALHDIAHQAIFDSLRALDEYDSGSARRLLGECLPPGFVPRPSAATRWSYVACYRVFGFSIAQRIARLRHVMRRASSGR